MMLSMIPTILILVIIGITASMGSKLKKINETDVSLEVREEVK